MKILVCIKQVPNTNNVKIDPVKGTLIREGVESIINPDDKNAIEEALILKDTNRSHVTVLTMGPQQAKNALYEAISMGVDEAVLLCDKAFAGSDTWATSQVLSKAIRHLGVFDLIFCGRQAIDGDTAQVGPQLAEQLNLPQVTCVKKIRKIDDRQIIVERALEDGFEVIAAELPALLTVVRELNMPRFPKVRGIVEAFEKPITVLGAEDIGIDPSVTGIKGSPTQVKRTFAPPAKAAGQRLVGSTQEVVDSLFRHLREKHIW